LAQTLQFLSDRFFVLPGFAFFDEPGLRTHLPLTHDGWVDLTEMCCLEGNCFAR
jgi:hypothetical protein